MGEHPKRRARVRLNLPQWLDAWPRGLRPEAAYLDAGRVEFLYQAPDSRWFLVGLWPGARVSEGWGPDPADLRRLSGALQHRLRRSPDAAKWLQDMVRFHRLLLTLPSFGGSRADDPFKPLDDLLQRSAQIRGGLGDASSMLSVGAPPGPPALGRMEDLHIGIRLANAQFEEALAEADAAPLEEESQALHVRAALIASLEGRVDAAREAALQASECAGAPGAFAAAQLLERLGHTGEAIECLSSSLSLVDGRGAAFERARRVSIMASSTRARAAAARAAERMERAATSRDERRACAEAWIGAGEFEKAEHLLRELLRTESLLSAVESAAESAADPADAAIEDATVGDDAATATLLATLLVWRGAASEAAELLRAQIDRAPSPEMLRTLGAAEYSLGHLAKSLQHLDAALELNSEDHQARLWRAEVLGASGELDAACNAIREVSLGDQVAWQLVRAHLEEQHTPGRRVEDDTWFIVDALLRPLLGEDAPPPAPTHEEALVALRRGLTLLGGNRSVTPTTVRNGKLRWEDELSSPRRRAERLQESLLHRPVHDVLAEFKMLATAPPRGSFLPNLRCRTLSVAWRLRARLRVVRSPVAGHSNPLGIRRRWRRRLFPRRRRARPGAMAGGTRPLHLPGG